MLNIQVCVKLMVGYLLWVVQYTRMILSLSIYRKSRDLCKWRTGWFIALTVAKGTIQNRFRLDNKGIVPTNELAPLTEYKGFSHEDGGLPLGQGAEVEDGETRFEDYIYSDRLKIPGTKTTFARASKAIEAKYKKREGDALATEAKRRELEQLSQVNDAVRIKSDREQGIKQGIEQSAFQLGLDSGLQPGEAEKLAKGSDIKKLVNRAIKADRDSLAFEGEETEMFAKGGKWIQKAVNPKHKGYCTPMTKSTRTPRRKVFAMTMKKHHGFHALGGSLYGDEMGDWAYGGPLYAQGDTSFPRHNDSRYYFGGGGYKDPNPSSKWTYDYKDGNWVGYNEAGKSFILNDPKYKSSVDILNKAYPDAGTTIDNGFGSTRYAPVEFSQVPGSYDMLGGLRAVEEKVPAVEYDASGNVVYPKIQREASIANAQSLKDLNLVTPNVDVKNTFTSNDITEADRKVNWRGTKQSGVVAELPRWYMYASQGVGDIYDIGMGLFANDKVNYDRVAYQDYEPEMVDYTPAVREAHRMGDLGTAEARRYVAANATGAGNLLSSYAANVAGLRGTEAAQTADIRMKQEAANITARNTARAANAQNRLYQSAANAQVQMNEANARQMEKDAKRSSISTGLHGLSQLGTRYSQDWSKNVTQNSILPMLNRANQELVKDENGNYSIQFKGITPEQLEEWYGVKPTTTKKTTTKTSTVEK